MVFTIYDWIYGAAQFAASFLAIIAGLISISLFRSAWKIKILSAWKYVLLALILFAGIEVIGGLVTFGVYNFPPYISHLTATFVLAAIIAALVIQLDVKRGWIK